MGGCRGAITGRSSTRAASREVSEGAGLWVTTRPGAPDIHVQQHPPHPQQVDGRDPSLGKRRALLLQSAPWPQP